MKLRTILAAVLIGATALACGGSGSTDWDINMSDFSVDLTSPWTEMGLPIGNGSVTVSESAVVSVNYTGESVSSVTQSYTDYFSSNGWTETYRDETSGTTVMYTKDNQTATLVVMDVLGDPSATVSLTTN